MFIETLNMKIKIKKVLSILELNTKHKYLKVFKIHLSKSIWILNNTTCGTPDGMFFQFEITSSCMAVRYDSRK